MKQAIVFLLFTASFSAQGELLHLLRKKAEKRWSVPARPPLSQTSQSTTSAFEESLAGLVSPDSFTVPFSDADASISKAQVFDRAIAERMVAEMKEAYTKIQEVEDEARAVQDATQLNCITPRKIQAAQTIALAETALARAIEIQNSDPSAALAAMTHIGEWHDAVFALRDEALVCGVTPSATQPETEFQIEEANP